MQMVQVLVGSVAFKQAWSKSRWWLGVQLVKGDGIWGWKILGIIWRLLFGPHYGTHNAIKRFQVQKIEHLDAAPRSQTKIGWRGNFNLKTALFPCQAVTSVASNHCTWRTSSTFAMLNLLKSLDYELSDNRCFSLVLWCYCWATLKIIKAEDMRSHPLQGGLSTWRQWFLRFFSPIVTALRSLVPEHWVTISFLGLLRWMMSTQLHLMEISGWF